MLAQHAREQELARPHLGIGPFLAHHSTAQQLKGLVRHLQLLGEGVATAEHAVAPGGGDREQQPLLSAAAAAAGLLLFNCA